MQLKQTTKQTEGESESWFDRVKETVGRRTGDESSDGSGRGTENPEERTEDESRGWFGRARAKYGLGALLFVAGAGLFLFPEPITSTAGMVLMGAGVLLWLVGWFR